ncbi:MAG: hypothetical protein SWO11_16880 [Thermodesulfobacteriota bacterium]|nr:hypothetical protein [Thermodesulfobacteriota bacterium]
MIDPEELMGSLMTVIQKNVKELSKMKDLEQRKIQSEVIKNLCSSLAIFFDYFANTMDLDLMEAPDFFDDEE